MMRALISESHHGVSVKSALGLSTVGTPRWGAAASMPCSSVTAPVAIVVSRVADISGRLQW